MHMQEHLLAALREQIDAWEALLAGLSEMQIHAPLPASEWRTKDILAHLYIWMNGYSLADVLLGTYDHHQEHYDKLVDWLKGDHGS